MSPLPVSESELHAYADGLVPAARRAEIDNHLTTHPDDAQRVRAWVEQNQALHELYDPILVEAFPARMRQPALAHRRRPVLRYAAFFAWFVLGGATGWYLQSYSSATSVDAMSFVRQAAIAHVVYSPEVRHPVEVGADQETHLVSWLSKRLGASLKVPQLTAVGYQLVGGRLLPGNRGPVAQFMFQDGNGQRLTLYVRSGTGDNKETAFRYAHERGIGVFYWLDGKFGYALSGEVDKTELLRVAKAVYQQLNP